jgi:hypothetical protein
VQEFGEIIRGVYGQERIVEVNADDVKTQSEPDREH